MVSDVCWTLHSLAGTDIGTPPAPTPGFQVHKARISALVHGWVFHTTHWQVSDACIESPGGWRDSCEHPWYRASHGTGRVWVDGEMVDAPFSCRCGLVQVEVALSCGYHKCQFDNIQACRSMLNHTARKQRAYLWVHHVSHTKKNNALGVAQISQSHFLYADHSCLWLQIVKFP